MLDLNSLLVFAKVIEAKSFSEAARLLKMPVSTVSRRIADLEEQLGVRLVERSTRNLRLTDVGSEILSLAQRSTELSESVSSIVSNQLTTVTGNLRISAPPSISDSLIAPLVNAFQTLYPDVRIQVLITERTVDLISEGVDVAFRVGALKDSSLIARKLLTYRRRLVASPEYLDKTSLPQKPTDLLDHRILAFSHWRSDARWTFNHVDGERTETIDFFPHLAINDYAGISACLLNGQGIGDLSPVVQPELVRDGRLVEVMPDWHFPVLDLSIVHTGSRQVPRPVRLFNQLAAEMTATLFPDLPS